MRPGGSTDGQSPELSGVYIHIPFCIRKCVYCDFLSFPYDGSMARNYTDALCKELETKKESAGTLKTIYIGGGTPTVLDGECFAQIFKCLQDNFRYYPIEVTVEANPGTIDKEKVEALRYFGVNRISLGVQSFDDDELKTLGRIHTSGEAVESIGMIKEAGINNFSIDLMYGIPGQTVDSWKETLSKAASFSPAHISSYELTPEKGTRLFKLIESNKIRMPDEGPVLEMYGYVIDYLSGCGYEHYEISNFALPGFRCMHNLNYWDRGEYIGVGAGAHSFVKGVRSRNTDDLGRYIKDLVSGKIPEAESSKLTTADEIKEFLFLGLRKTEGISVSKAKGFGLDLPELCKGLIPEGYLELSSDNIRLTRKGRVILNTIVVRLFEELKLD